MPRSPLSVTIITLNEEDNIRLALESVSWADDIFVVDSGSTDRTVEIAKGLGARVVYNPWPGYGQQKNFAQRGAAHDWVLNIDADEVVSQELRTEIERLLNGPGGTVRGYLLPRKTYYLGRWIRHGGWYPNYLLRLADRRYSSWTEPNVHEELKTQGETRKIEVPLLHYAFSSIHEQILTNVRFSRLGSEDLQRRGQRPSLKMLLWKPFEKFLVTYFIRRGFVDGLPGFIISVNAAHSIFLKYAYLMESKIRKPRT